MAVFLVSAGGAGARATTLESAQELRFLVLGDAGVGKTSLVQASVSRSAAALTSMSATAAAPASFVLPDDRAAAALQGREAVLNPRVVLDSDGARLGEDAAALARELARATPDAVLLCFALDAPASLERLATHWLPALAAAGAARPHWPFLPVCLVATKADIAVGSGGGGPGQVDWLAARRAVRSALLSQGVPDSSLQEEAEDDAGADAVRLRALAVGDLLVAHRCIQTNASVSARAWALGAAEPQPPWCDDLPTLWLRASSVLLHPVFPLIALAPQAGDEAETEAPDQFTPAASAAIGRIFRLLDRDGDCVLSADEFGVFQTVCFGHRVAESEVQAFFALKAASEPDCVCPLGGAGDALALTEAGFVSMMAEHVFHMNTDPDPSAWQVLHAFGYRWGLAPGAVAKSLFLYVPDSFLALPPLPAEALADDQRRSGAAAAAAAAGGGAGRPRLLQLSGTALASDYASALLDVLCARRLEGTGLGFVARLFRRCTAASGRAVLSQADVNDLFSVTPAGAHPFGALYPSVTTHNFSGDVGLHCWLHLWQALLAAAPRQALAALYGLGFVAPARGTECDFDYDSRRAVEWGAPRRAAVPAPSVAAAAAAAMAAAVPRCTTRRVFVVGSAGSGKTSVVMHFLNGANGLREHVQAVAAEDGTADGGRQAPRPTLAPTLFAAAQPITAPAAGAAAGSADDPYRVLAPLLPSTLAITEWPAAMLREALCGGSGRCDADAVLVVVDPSRPESVAYLRRAAELLPDGVPLAVVAADHTVQDGRKVEAKEGFKVLQALCERRRAKCAAGGAGAGALEDEGRVDLRAVTSSTAHWALPSAGAAGDVHAAQGGAEAHVLDVELFTLSPRDKDARSLAIFEYLAAVSTTPGRDNPRTLARRRRARDAIFWRRVRTVATVAAAAAAVAAVAALWSDGRVRSGLRGLFAQRRAPAVATATAGGLSVAARPRN